MHVHVPVCAHVHVGYINFEAVVHSFVYISPVESANYEFCTLRTHTVQVSDKVNGSRGTAVDRPRTDVRASADQHQCIRGCGLSFPRVIRGGTSVL